MKRTLLATAHRHGRRRARRRARRVGRRRAHRRLDDAQARPRHRRRARRPRRLRRSVGRARAGAGGVRFPITGGRIDARTAAGTIRHAGGLRFSAGRRSLTLRAPRVAVGRKIMLSARVGGGRVHLLELSGARVSRSGFNTNVSGLRARLTQKAATRAQRDVRRDGVQEGPAARHRERALAHGRGGHPGAQRHLARDRSGRAAGADEPGHRPRRDRAGDARGHDRGLPDRGRPGQARPLRGDDPPPGRHLAHQGLDRGAPGVVRRAARARARSCSRRSTAARRRPRSSTSTSPGSRRRSTGARSRWPASRPS